MPDDDFVPIFSAKTAGEAEVARLALESAGIAANVAGKQFADLFGLFEFQVLVRPSDQERAAACLADRSATDDSEIVAEADNSSESKDGDSSAPGFETPAVLSLLRSALNPISGGRLPSWLRRMIR